MASRATRKPAFAPEMERCLAAAKALAAKEPGLFRLDALHLLLAAIRVTPKAAKAALEQAGYRWEAAENASPEVNSEPPAEVAQRPVKLVPPLPKLVHQWTATTRNGGKSRPLSAEQCLTALLENPSVRLQDFLRRLPGRTSPTKPVEQPADDHPFQSCREFLDARRAVWALRRAATHHLRSHPDRVMNPRLASRAEGKQEGTLAQLASLEETTRRRVAASPDPTVPLRRFAARHELSAIQSEVIEGLLLYELYGAETPPPSVRDFAQMLAPETYPVNAAEMVDQVARLCHQDLVQVHDPLSDATGLNSRLRLTPHLAEELLTVLQQDVISDADVKATKRRLSVCQTWPV